MGYRTEQNRGVRVRPVKLTAPPRVSKSVLPLDKLS
jgi:hypothetical protein